MNRSQQAYFHLIIVEKLKILLSEKLRALYAWVGVLDWLSESNLGLQESAVKRIGFGSRK